MREPLPSGTPQSNAGGHVPTAVPCGKPNNPKPWIRRHTLGETHTQELTFYCCEFKR